MGMEGRPSRTSKQRAMERVSLQQRDELEELDLDGDVSMRPTPARRSRRKSIHESSSDDERSNSLDDSNDDHPLGTGTFNQHTSVANLENQHGSKDHSPIDEHSTAAPPEILQAHSPHHNAEADDADLNDVDSNYSDEDYGEKKSKPMRRSLPLRIRIADGVVTKSGRISKPPKPISPELSIPHRRPKEQRPETPPSREERYRRRSERNYGSELISTDSIPPLQGRSPLRPRRRQRSKALPSFNGSGENDFEDDDEVLGKGNGDDTFESRHIGSAKTRSRVVKMEDLDIRRSGRTRARSKPSSVTPEPGQVPYALRLRSRTTPNGIGKSGRVQRNGLSYSRNYDEEAMDGEEHDGDFRTPDESEEAEELANDEDEDVIAQGSREDISDDDFMNSRPSRLPSRRNRKARPQRSIQSKRKRPRTRNDREQNSLARETKRSYRTRRSSLRREDFYHESDPSSESSESSEDPDPKPTRSSPTRRVTVQPNESTEKNIGEVDFLKNPMAILDSIKQSRPRHVSRYSRRRGKLRPSGPEPTASDGDDGPGSSVPPIEPIQVDLNLSWDDIGGLDHHIRALKEMVFLPLMYPEVFEKFHIEAPKGVLFYGPPGTGKTLCARALAASCGSIANEAGPESAVPPSTVHKNAVNKNAVHTNPKPSEGLGKNVENHKENEQPAEHSKECVDSDMNNMSSKSSKNEKDISSSRVELANEHPSAMNEHVLENAGVSREIAAAPTQAANASRNNQEVPLEQRNGKIDSQSKITKMTETHLPKSSVKKKPRVSFFMRNGADCLSKWVGEAERQLRMTFEAAKKHEPAIIFFDEIDGLAPVRSSRQDQIHSSIVSTLLGLMDGLDSRGQIIVIGATNRVDAIDPALRRPGRFDRELIFTLPNLQARRRILDIHTSNWKPPPKPEVLDAVAKMTVGYCGADMKSLCSESAIRALRRRYPQIYNSHEKLLIDVDQVRVSRKDFLSAMKDIVPASHRSARTHARPIPERLLAVLSHPLQSCIFILERIFPQGLGPDAIQRCGLSASTSDNVGVSGQIIDDAEELSSSDEESELDVNMMQDQIANAGKIRETGLKQLSTQQRVLRPRLLLCGQQGLGQAQIGPALLHFCEGCPVHAIDFPSLHADGAARSAEEALISAFREASRSVPSVLYLPHLQLWWESAPQSLRTTLVVALKDLPSDLPVLVLATAEVPISELPAEVTELFGDMHELSVPSEEHRSQLFAPLVKTSQERPKLTHAEVQVRRRRRVREVLPKAPPPPPKVPTVEEQAQKIQSEDRYIRALRMEMRGFVENLLRDKRFKAFWNPVDPNSAPDYYEIIKTPMDITQIAGRIDSGSYPTVLAMVNDFDIMMKNAIQYNPPNTEVGAAILRRAHGLIDIVHAWVDNLNPALVETCNKIIADRIARAEREVVALEHKKAKEMENVMTDAEVNGTKSGEDGKIDHQEVRQLSAGNATETLSRPSSSQERAESDDPMKVDNQKIEAISPGILEPPQQCSATKEVVVSEKFIASEPEQVAKLQKLVLDVSTGMTVDGLEGLYVRCEKVLHERRRSMDRASVVKALIRTVLLARDDPALVGNLVE